MEKERGFKVIAVVALLIAIIGVSVGFAAFTTTLTINASTATVPAASNTLNTEVVFGTASVVTPDAAGSTAGTTSGQTWNSSTVAFTSAIREVEFKAPIINSSAYNVYLSSMEAASGAKITCTNGTGDSAASDDIFNSYCAGTTATYQLGTTEVVCTTTSCTTTLNNYTLPKTSGSVDVTLTVATLASTTGLPDGAITVNIPGITLGFTTTAPTS